MVGDVVEKGKVIQVKSRDYSRRIEMRTNKFSRTLCTLLCLAFILGVTTVSYARLPMNQFGDLWVRTHHFQIGNYSTGLLGDPADELQKLINLYTTGFVSGSPTALSYAASAGMNPGACLWINASSVSGGQPTQATIDNIDALSTPGFSGIWMTGDDMYYSDDIAACGIVNNYLYTTTPNALTCSVEGYDSSDPTTVLNDILTNSHPDMFMGQLYPYFLSSYPSCYPEDANWFRRMKVYRDRSIAYGIPYMTWLPAFEGDGDTAFWRSPSESEMRAVAYTALTMGCKGYSWFGYDDSDARCTNWLVDLDTREPTQWYYWAKTIDAEAQVLGEYLRFLIPQETTGNTGVRFIPNTGHSTPTGLVNWSSGAGGDNYIYWTSMSPNNANQDALIGFFKDAQGQQYFMLQNLYRGPNLSASQASTNFTVDYTGSTLPVPGHVYRLDRSTGQSVDITLRSGIALDVTMTGGTAELYSYRPFSLDQVRNKVVNPGMEYGTTGWNTAWGGNNTWLNDASKAHSGSYSMRVGYPGGGGSIETLSATPDTVYKLTGWLNPVNGLGILGLYAYTSGGSWISTCQPYVYTSGSGYNQYSLTVSMPSNAGQIGPYFYNNSATNYLYADDYSLTVVGLNHVKNAGFEAGSDGNWNLGWGNATIQNDPSHSHWSSTYNVRVGPGDGGAYQMVGAEPNKQYTLSSWMNQTVNDGMSLMGVQAFDGDGTWISTFQPNVYTPTSGAGAYAPYSISFTSPSNAETLKIYVYKNAGSGGYVYADDYILTDDGQNLLQNPGFESGNTNWNTGWGNATAVNNNTHNWTTLYSMRVGTGEGGAYQEVPAVPNEKYTLTGWCKPTVNDGASILGVQAFDSDGNWISSFQPAVYMSGTSYAQYTLDFTTPANTAKVRAYVYKSPGSGGYLYADDLCLLRK